MSTLVIALHMGATVMVAMVFEWLWVQGFVKGHSKRVICQAYWMLLCVASFACTSTIPLLTAPLLMGVGYMHVDLVRADPATRINPGTLLRHIPKVIRHALQRLLKH